MKKFFMTPIIIVVMTMTIDGLGVSVVGSPDGIRRGPRVPPEDPRLGGPDPPLWGVKK